MAPTTLPRAVAFLFFGSMFPVSAQSFSDTTRHNDVRSLDVSNLEGRDVRRFQGVSLPVAYEVPAMKASAYLQEDGKEVFVSQDAATLGTAKSSQSNVETVVDLSTLREPSAFRKAAVSAGTSSVESAATNLTGGLALLAATYRTPGEKSDTDCPGLGLSIQQRVKMDPSRVLEIVESEVAANKSCSCEIVKAALNAVGADVELTAQIVEVASTAAPESMRLISQCAIAAVPEALTAVQSVLARLDPGSGESYSSKSSKSSKSGKEIIAPPRPPKAEDGNPLDLPPLGPPLPPAPFNPPVITDVDSYIPMK